VGQNFLIGDNVFLFSFLFTLVLLGSIKGFRFSSWRMTVSCLYLLAPRSLFYSITVDFVTAGVKSLKLTDSFVSIKCVSGYISNSFLYSSSLSMTKNRD